MYSRIRKFIKYVFNALKSKIIFKIVLRLSKYQVGVKLHWLFVINSPINYQLRLTRYGWWLSVQQILVVTCGRCEDTRCGGSSGRCCCVSARRREPGCWPCRSSPPHRRRGESPAPRPARPCRRWERWRRRHCSSSPPLPLPPRPACDRWSSAQGYCCVGHCSSGRRRPHCCQKRTSSWPGWRRWWGWWWPPGWRLQAEMPTLWRIKALQWLLLSVVIWIPWKSNSIFYCRNTSLRVLFTDSVNCLILLLSLLAQTVKTLIALRRFLLSRTLSTVRFEYM